MEIPVETEKPTLSNCESILMKAIWESGSDVSIQDLMNVLKNKFDKDYKRTTVVTFLLRMTDKGYVKSYRIGRLAFVHAIVTEDEFKTTHAMRETDFWYDGMASEYLEALCAERELSEEDISRLKSIVDRLSGE